MSERVVLHVGLPKSGTTFVQRQLTANKEGLAEDGLLFPGATWYDQVLAVREVREMRRQPRRAEGAWGRLVDEIGAWPGTSVVSMEWLCAADADHARSIVRGLGTEQVEVVFTVRDLARTLPAAWQEFMQNRRTWSWPEFLAGVSGPDAANDPAGQAFWAQQDLPELLARWSGIVRPDRVHVVTLPPPGADPDVLWQRMTEILRVDPARHPVQPRRGNESLGLESTTLMHRLNPLTRAAGIPKEGYTRAFKQALAKRGLAQRRDSERRLAVPESYRDWVTSTADRHVAQLRASGVNVVGDPEDLRPVFSAGAQPEDVTDQELLEVALDAVVVLGQEVVRVSRERQALERRLRQEPDDPPRAGWLRGRRNDGRGK